MEPKDDHHQVVDHHLTTPTTTGTSFSQLLFGDDDDEGNALAFGVDHHTFNYNNNLGHNPPLFSVDKAPKMLCFGDYKSEGEALLLPEANSTPQKSVITSSDSSSASSCNQSSTGITSLSKSNSLQKKRNGSAQQPVSKAGVGGQSQRVPNKKTKAENPASIGHAKRKEKLGERITALQQLVSPFGKTDTASVLHEAMGYIRFLHDQVQVLCSPYLQRLPSSPYLQHQHQPGDDGDNNGDEEGDGHSKDLRSRGLCLVPVECTVHVASTNGADFWSPASLGNINVSPSV